MYTYALETLQIINKQDPILAQAIECESKRQERNLELIASENIVSEQVMAAMGTVLTNKYAEGYPSKRYYGGCEHVDVVENLAIDRAKTLFNAKYANVQPHSGSQANFGAYFGLLEAGDTILGMDLSSGGHLTHGSAVNFSGKNYNFISYGIDNETHRIDYDKLREQALATKPKMIVAGASAYPRAIDFEKFSEIAKECGAYLMVDMAHIAGLVAAGLHQSPMEYADVVTTTTHKTLRGPRGGMILTNNEEIAKKVNKAIFPGSQGGPLMHVIAAKAVCFGEALEPSFVEYQKQVIKNSKALEKSLTSKGFTLVSGGTDNHLLLIDLRNFGITGKDMEKMLDEVYITVNKNSIPNEPLSPFITSGIRIGTPAITTRGLVEEDMEIVAECMYLVAKEFEESKDNIRKKVTGLCQDLNICIFYVMGYALYIFCHT